LIAAYVSRAHAISRSSSATSRQVAGMLTSQRASRNGNAVASGATRAIAPPSASSSTCEIGDTISAARSSSTSISPSGRSAAKPALM
jgi:hypothetical protein